MKRLLLAAWMAPFFAAAVQANCPAMAIGQVQGQGDSSPYQNQQVTVQGVLSATSQQLLPGFVITGDSDQDPATSDALFIAAPAPAPLGSLLCISGTVTEVGGQTQLTPSQVQVLKNEGALPQPSPLHLASGQSLAQALEAHEGMRITLSKDSNLYITRTFSYDYGGRRNNLVLSHGGPLVAPTEHYPAGSDQAKAQALANSQNRLVLESDLAPAPGTLPYYPDFAAKDHYLRVGDRLSGLSGTVLQSHGQYRLLVDGALTQAQVEHTQDRSAAPALAKAGNLKVASFNVLNYFNSAVGGDANPTGQNRGAKSAEDFALQRTKIVSAMTAIDADLFGLMEIENNGFGEGSALKDLVSHLNAVQGNPALHYDYVRTDAGNIGEDAITVAILYRPARLALDGKAKVLAMPHQQGQAQGPDGRSLTVFAGQRASLAQGFTRINGSQRSAPFTLVVNHFKSKGSPCIEDYPHYSRANPPHGQGHCNALRVSAAQVLGQALPEFTSPVLAIGDFNAYSQEDPLLALTTGGKPLATASHALVGQRPLPQQSLDKGFGLVDLNRHFDSPGYSYSYDGEQGSLDHALASPALLDKVVAVSDWHINAAESPLFEYPRTHTGDLAKDQGPYRSSDHDPVVIALNLPVQAQGGAGLPLALLALAGLLRRRRA